MNRKWSSSMMYGGVTDTDERALFFFCADKRVTVPLHFRKSANCENCRPIGYLKKMQNVIAETKTWWAFWVYSLVSVRATSIKEKTADLTEDDRRRSQPGEATELESAASKHTDGKLTGRWFPPPPQRKGQFKNVGEIHKKQTKPGVSASRVGHL